jgi:dihydroneopterin aldolase
MQKVLLENVIFHAHHGLFDEETIVGGKFEVNLAVETDFSLAADQDNINGTVNYVALYELVKEEVQKPSKLIEHLAGRIVKRIKNEFTEVQKVHIKISKLNPPISGEVGKVSVEMEE